MTLPYYNFGYKGSLGTLPLNEGPNIPFVYKLVEKSPNPFLDLDVVKAHLKIDGDSEDSYLSLLIEAVGNYLEAYTGLTLLTSTYETYRDFFCSYFYIKKSPFQLVDSIDYLKNGSFTLVNNDVYYATVNNHYSSICLNPGKSYPSDVDNVLQAIRITFKAGFGDNSSDIPADLRLAMLNHIASLYEDRGDCDDCSCKEKMPKATKLIYSTYVIHDIGATTQIG